MVFGDLNRNASFFLETDQTNFGKSGDWASPAYIQDAFMTLKPADFLMFDAGMILLPFTRLSFMGAVGLNALDYHAAMIKYPEGSTKVWRDTGLQARSSLFDKRLQVRAGIFSGSQNVALQKDATTAKAIVSSNPKDRPRFTGNVRWSFLGTETDFFPKGIYFAKDPVVSVGVGGDYAPDSVLLRPAVLTGGVVTTPGAVGNHSAAAADVFAEWPLDEDNEIIFQAAGFWYQDGSKIKTSGLGGLAELGYRIGIIEPVLVCDFFDGKPYGSDALAMRGGVNWWISKHATNVKLLAGMEKAGVFSRMPYYESVTLQGQIYF
jgi:hypothetical protein